ncbi:MAG: curli assembly protein CsgF [archaeon]
MKKLFLVTVALLAFVSVLAFVPTNARADFGPWGFGNPTFINGNSFNGQYYLDKAKSTNEYQDDPVKRIERMMNKMMDDLKAMMDDLTDSIDNLTLNFDYNFNYIIQSGSYNSAILLPGSGMLGGFNPSWGFE